MLRRGTVIAFVLALFGATVGVAVATLRSRAVRMVAVPTQEVSKPGAATPHWDVARIDPLPGLDSLDLLTAPVEPAPSKPRPVIDVAAVQRRLSELKYYIGPIDGSRGGATRSAVMAFQKVNGLGADGSIGPATLAALEQPHHPSLRGGPAKRVEVDLSRQVLYYVEGGQLVRVMPVSSGNGSSYEKKDGGIAQSLTPVGTFRIQRTISGVREADLGTLYDPMYFYQGWAIHGSDSVPAFPASHGCVRVTRTDAVWLLSRVSVGTTVMLYGGSHTFTPGSSAPGTTTPAGDGPIQLPDREESEREDAPSTRSSPQSSRPEPTSPEVDGDVDTNLGSDGAEQPYAEVVTAAEDERHDGE